MQYASFEDYKVTYLKGRSPCVPETDFDFWAERSQEYVDVRTFSRLENEGVFIENKDAIVKTVCEVAERLYKNDISPKLKSRSISKYSETFADDRTIEVEVAAIIRRNLGHTGLLYRGAGYASN